MNPFIILLPILLFSLNTYADLIFNPCLSHTCSLPQKEILDRFTVAQSIMNDFIPSVYSGDCYHLSPYFDPTYRHFGVIMFDGKEDQFYSFGKYGFFYDTNPYKQLTVEDFRNESNFSYSSVNQLSFDGMDAVADYTIDPASIWRYYFRQDVITSNILVIGFWSKSHILFCNLIKHDN